MAERVDQDKCSICLSGYKQPKILDCQHSFCQICLKDYVHRTSSNGHFQCPLCRRDATLPEGGVKNIPSKPTNDAPRCGFIDGCENESSFRCRDCDQKLCRSCRRNHDSLKVLKGHVVDSWDEPGPKRDKPEAQPVHDERDLCPCGKGKMVEYLCELCSKCVCYKCCIKYHNGHKLKDLQDEDVKQQITDEMVSLNDELKQHINQLSEFRETVKTKKTEVAATVEEICGKIDVQVKKVCDEVTRIGENFKEDVKKIYLQDEENASSTTSDITSFNKLLEDIKISIRNMTANVKSSTIVLEERSIVQKVDRLDQLRQEVNDCGSRKMVIPSVPVMNVVAGEIDRDILSKQVGRVVGREGMFEVYFSVDDLFDYCDSREVEYGGLTWSVSEDENVLDVGRIPCNSREVDDVWDTWGQVEREVLPLPISLEENVLTDVGRNQCDSREVECGGLPWCVSVDRGLNGNVMIALNLIETPRTPCKIDYSIKLVNINNDQQSVIKHHVNTFTVDEYSTDWMEFLSWKKFTHRRAGFIDDNNQIKVQVRLKVEEV